MYSENKYIKRTIFWDVTLCHLVGQLLVYWRNILPPSLVLKSNPSKQQAKWDAHGECGMDIGLGKSLRKNQ
jgi:hypothetical protein